jgi:4-hydroxythreonine-4-phosphate dehydrogenase
MVAGLNPHAGESGAIWVREEIDDHRYPRSNRSAPRVSTFSGPYCARTRCFTKPMRDTYDAALCMYHDQALIPLKTLHFDEGVNMTLGLPIVRTSPDHGTAFGIAGKISGEPWCNDRRDSHG